MHKGLKRLQLRIALNDTPVTELRDVTCHMGSHSVTCYPTQVNAPRPNPSPQAGTRFTYPRGWKAEYCCRPRLPGNAPTGSRTCDLSITSQTPQPLHHHRATQKGSIMGNINLWTEARRRVTVSSFSESYCNADVDSLPRTC